MIVASIGMVAIAGCDGNSSSSAGGQKMGASRALPVLDDPRGRRYFAMQYLTSVQSRPQGNDCAASLGGFLDG
ncbi:hypothetical protein [Embleya scabrispora]|uniref:hypothetical protein n=1 Tax=Embleya scabrispora TaxID=159449 RepID=UPI0003AA2636|nr:hypothetical protein [Embleya scabrispora]MYS80651.1 hypothetical protein [Streptomyces sp. SID5474]